MRHFSISSNNNIIYFFKHIVNEGDKHFILTDKLF